MILNMALSIQVDNSSYLVSQRFMFYKQIRERLGAGKGE